ncbi:MAG: cytochrome c-type biogenesis protein CcmH [Gammaproteobacteria bacterium]|nr:cytochrome c-type biogenesis protein CcmH [Gammaproteobacteria bacterium]MDH5659367.1 cytochrome c-type biogenesis protein CcmH [Gammaproteobacteria bacterium]
MKKVAIILSFLFLLNPSTYAAVEVKQFKNPEHEKRYKALIIELRCVVCQNQNIAESNAALAKDLRKQVFKMINAGESDDDILEFMVTRYGDFVLYDPQFNSTTFLLWVGPFIIFIIGLYILVSFIRQRKTFVVAELSNEDKEKLKQLLENKEQTK